MAQASCKDQQAGAFEYVEKDTRQDEAAITGPVADEPGGVLKLGRWTGYNVEWEHGPVEDDYRQPKRSGQALHMQIAHKKPPLLRTIRPSAEDVSSDDVRRALIDLHLPC
jgi:hypothetical protein